MTNVSMNNHESKTFRDNALQTFWGYDDRRPRGISCTSRSERAELMKEGWGGGWDWLRFPNGHGLTPLSLLLLLLLSLWVECGKR